MYVGYLVAYELEFKVMALIDVSFESSEALRNEIISFIGVHYEPTIINPQNRLAQHIIEKTNQEFCDYLDNLLLQKDSLAPADLPYMRVILGPEAAALKSKFNSIWKYVNSSYWFPLIGNEPKEIANKFFVVFDRFEPYMEQMDQILGLPQTHMFCYGESFFRPEHVTETSELIEYGGNELIYTDKEFSWAIYFSHENTVSFAGSIVPKVQELLLKEKTFWDKFDWEYSEE